MKRVAVMFPGQGSQDVGMGKDFYEEYEDVRALYEKANELLGKNLTSLMLNGPIQPLTETENAQPALLLNSIAIYQQLQKEGIEPVMAVGHSLGEYSALSAAGSITIEDALPLVQTRGRLMEEAFPKGQGTMAAVLGLSSEEIAEGLKEVKDEIVDMANLNCPGQIVISGTKTGIEQVSDILKEKGARRVMPLNVSGPFHSRLMKAANEKFSDYLNQIEIEAADIPVYANVTAQPVESAEEIKDLLIRQLYSPVRFEQSIRNMLDQNIDAFVEVGNGKVLSGLLRKIDRKTKTFAIQDIPSMMEFISWYEKESE